MSHIHDYVGVGFGPSNLALAIATQEFAQGVRSPDVCFLERKPAFAWHEGMLIDGSTMQISFLKDLATLRNPQSRFTFINYLMEQGRLEDFINIQTFFPTREEYNDYLSWAASKFEDQVHYGQSVQSVEPLIEGGKLTGMEVLSRDKNGEIQRRRARNLVLGMGGEPQVPQAFEGINDPRILHSSQYRGRIETLLADSGRRARVAVVGGGQSAAEIFEDITNRFPHVDASMILRGTALKPSDDSPFVNEIFNPSFIDQIFQQPEARRHELLTEFRNTNYAVVDLELIERIYQMFYLQKLRREERHQMLPRREVARVETGEGGLHLTLRDLADDSHSEQGFDAVVLATGYRRDQHHELLAGLGDHLESFTPDRNYRLRLRNSESRIYLQGCCEVSHGLSDTLLSVLAVRSQEILESIFLGRSVEPQVRTERETRLTSAL
ncbi:lysine N(6)-hydroxylase/L-ornithine N(5)-oxygenase family protein [Marinobacter nanhaiticus D15-8W]|uniref:Ornithine monooxygenase n=1 Tax=Marinobacter nanhaiticus D15-8W TaxID=626887 RepID=N6W943_9GAMM|nr:lysine N(6)-hydroxylase/L-ornithine N(5)-oxygenase family protein [Marinobacter nanhaiticus]ENO16764.1 ornithine monooxygenase [Marinobacter nanhaiticus D15-8W]BES72575.1 lysine N(6)-hydroxylase/L-ornithine N(5)-oxygenase family protein [Marinobacter nanhaiticus D15-8W]